MHDNAFWIIFDTSTHRAYYKDVHNLLALPRLATLRYNYREALITEDAISLVASSKRPVLFIYAQRDALYSRTNGTSIPDDTQADYRYIATRIGTMLNVVKLGNHYHFDFAVAGYPINNATTQSLITDLEASNSVPANEKFVCSSTRLSDFETLRTSDDNAAWQGIVELLSTPPMQFSNDAFWKLNGPFTKKGKAHRPIVRVTRASEGPKQSEAVYHAGEHTYQTLGITTQMGNGAKLIGRDFEIVAKSSDPSLIVQGSGVYPLRRYNYAKLEYNTSDPPPFFYAKRANLEIQTQPDNSGWPAGPDLSIAYSIARNKLTFALGIIYIAFGFFSWALAFNVKLFNHAPFNPLADIALGLLGLILSSGGVWLLTGKLGLQKPL